jgi:hypothetical protein
MRLNWKKGLVDGVLLEETAVMDWQLRVALTPGSAYPCTLWMRYTPWMPRFWKIAAFRSRAAAERHAASILSGVIALPASTRDRQPLAYRIQQACLRQPAAGASPSSTPLNRKRHD